MGILPAFSIESLFYVLYIFLLGIFLFRLWKMSTVVIQTCQAIMRYIEKEKNDTDT